ncbi:PQQ-binding-like beta-propeller repeat protein [Roseibium porphyridii]|uniref:PQQ-binding-like beta-propeller repeat protein n=1 Tax=Roseibium porphyridii TaxID=2866279 RepID=A0ABY8F5S0_9HYPH|nr:MULTISPECIES: PQQ-binding-like beta-propeller repeat protein [Stappiaceae]QFT32728.1 Outer membrane protein assembly factor BamB precursor [Labrenzia sp. THAF82]WFE88053.1 PQQ-binding-like beta-propeller repeat protein [Roseibium sp. KMA01]
MTRAVVSSMGRGPLAVIALSLALTGCGSVSDFTQNVNPFNREKILSGDRQPVFDGADPASEALGQSAKVGPATGGQSWTTAGGGLTNDPGNIAISVSGNRAWRTQVGTSGRGLTSSALRISSRPVSDGSRIYLYKPNGEVVALSTGGGRQWTANLRPEGERDVGPGGGVTVAGGIVYAATSYRQLVALEAGSGREIWRADLDTPARGAPVAGAGHVFVVSQSNEVYALSQSDGSVAWSYAGVEETAGLLSAANPAISGNKVIVPFSSGEIMAIDIKSGEPEWIDGVSRGFRTLALSGLADVSASPVIAGNTVYATGVAGRTVAVDARSGQRRWEQDLGSVHTPVVSGNALFMVDLDDRMVALDLKSGEPLWATSLPRPEKKKRRRNWAGPILANGALVAFSSDGQIAVVDAASGNTMLTQRTNADVYVTPIVAGGRVVVLTGNDGVAAYN